VDGPQVRVLRRRAGWSQVELARRAGMGQAAVSRVENSGRTYPHIVARLAAALGVSTVGLMATRDDSLRGLRRAAGLTEQHVVDRLRLPRSSYGGWERGEWPVPRRHVQPLADVIGVNPQQIVEVCRQTRRVTREGCGVSPDRRP
jgi:transcriptional regulator with XRE-family HTH domain